MKKGLVLVLVLVLALSLGAFAFDNEPEGFRGLKWGDPPAEDMEYFKNPFEICYTLPYDKMSIGNAQFYMIIYVFYQDRFLGTGLYFEAKENYDLLEIICKERYGEKELQEGFYTLDWVGQKSYITLYYDIVEEKGVLVLNSKVITLEKFEADKKKEAEKAEGDW